jgi:hypothetical protein
LRPASPSMPGKRDSATASQAPPNSRAQSLEQSPKVPNAPEGRLETSADQTHHNPGVSVAPNHVEAPPGVVSSSAAGSGAGTAQPPGQSTAAAARSNSVLLDPQAAWEDRIKSKSSLGHTTSAQRAGSSANGNAALAMVLPFHAMVSGMSSA